jgi:Kef-type K+ transport system membrane component KefB
LGTLITLQLGYSPKAAILIGSFWASFTLIAYPVLKQFDLTKNRAGAATLGASAITDTISLLVLALVSGSETGDQSGARLVLMIALGLVVLALWCLIILPWISRWFFSTLGRGRILRFMLVLGGLTSSAVVAELVGIEPLLGAFLAGLGLNRLVPNESELMERVDFFGNALFIPAFLVSVGLMFDPAVMFKPSTIVLALLLSAALVAGKAAAAWLTGRVFRLTRAESGLLFSVSVAQAAATLAATVIGLELGLYGEEVVNAVMVVIAVSLFVTSLATPRFAERIEKPEAEERRLGDRVLVPTHGPSRGLSGRLHLAGQIAEVSGGLVVPVVVAVPHQDEDLSDAKARLLEIDETLHALGLEGDSRIRVDRSLTDGIKQAALENDASLVLLGWQGPRPITTYFVESVADEVSRLVECPVAVAAISETPVEQVALAISKNDLNASRLERLKAAVSIATSAAAHHPLVVGPADPAHLVEAGINLPEKTEHEPGDMGVIPWVEQTAQENSLIVSLSRGWTFDRIATQTRKAGCSVVAVSTG